MAEITERQKFILEGIVREYIKKATPVSSESLGQKYKIGLSPASIRLEFKKLTEMGYLEKPHISAGRVPTDMGYRFFVDEILAEREDEQREAFQKSLEGLEKEIEDLLRLFSHLAKTLAQLSSSLALVYLEKERLCFKEGLEKVILNPEFEDACFTKDFMRFLGRVESEIEKWTDRNLAQIKVFIGRETRIPFGKNCGVILTETDLPSQEKGIFLLLGPKRMDYPKNIGLMRSLLDFFDSKENIFQ